MRCGGDPWRSCYICYDVVGLLRPLLPVASLKDVVQVGAEVLVGQDGYGEEAGRVVC